MAAIAAVLVGAGGLAVITHAHADKTPVLTVTPAAERAPVKVVLDLPHLKATLDRQPNFTGGILVAKGDQILFRQVYGMANAAERRPMALDSQFRLASISKQFTAAAILKLQDEGRLKISDPVCKWIEDCPSAWTDIKLWHLLSHTSGIPDLMARPGWGTRRVTPATLDELTRDSKAFGLQFAPGDKIRYDNAAYNLAAAVVEKASGMGFDQYLISRFFKPLGMDHTGIGDGDNLAMGYANLPGGIAPQPNANVSIVHGAGAIYSTLDDLLVWQQALHHGRVLSAAAYAQMIADHAPADTPSERGHPRRDWGLGVFSNSLGLQVRPSFGDRQIYHTGSWAGFRNLESYQPDADVTVIVLSNNYHQRDQVFMITQQAMAEALGRPFPTELAR